MKKFLIRCFWFLIGAGLVTIIELYLTSFLSAVFNIQFGSGIGWIIPPIVFGIVLAKVSPKPITLIISKIRTFSKPTRIVLVFSLLWIFLVGTFVFVFEPRGYGYMDSDDFLNMVKIMIFPPFVLLVVYFVYKKVISDNSES